MNIIDKIDMHIKSYQGYGKEIPPYRITCSEHKELSNIINKKYEDKNTGMISMLNGIQLEVVMKVDEYF